MPDTEASMLRRLDTVERNGSDLAKSVTNIADHVGKLTEGQIEADKRAIADAKDKEHLDERLDRIERAIAGIYRLGWWILAAFGTSAIALVANFAFRGGFFVPGA